MGSDIILVLCMLAHLPIPSKLAGNIFYESIKRLSVVLQISEAPEVMSYSLFKEHFYESIVLPDLSFCFHYNDGDDINDGNYTWYHYFKVKQCDKDIEYLGRLKNNHLCHLKLLNADDNGDGVAIIDSNIENLRWRRKIWDSIDDIARNKYPWIEKRRLVKYVIDQIGLDNFLRKNLPEPAFYLD